ncbi:FAD dependent oxidoreductase [Phellopilus nigrolimitatus]|nr:FAD dependent oxidoreductase [Phellopilus nigrolimitatus]
MGVIVSKVKVLRIAVRQVLELSASYERLQKRIQVDPGLPVANPTVSFWHDVPSPIASHRPHSLPEYADVVIIGSGITGTSVARTLFREGSDEFNVVMLEARDACSGATGRNGGHIKPPLHHDYLDLKKKHGAEQAAKLIRFRLMHVRETLAAAAEEGISNKCQGREVDSLDVYFAPKTFEQAKAQLMEWKKDMPEETEDYNYVEGDEAIERFHLSSNVVGVVNNMAGAVHPYRFVTNILARLLNEHADRFCLSTNTPCTAVLPPSPSSPSLLYTVVTPRGKILTPHVVHATNAWCSHLLPELRTKIFCVRGNMTAQRPGTALSPSSLDGGRSWVFYDKHVGYDYLTQLPGSEHELMFGGGFVQAGEDGLGEIGTSDDSQFNPGIAAHLAGVLPLLFGGENWGSETLPHHHGKGGKDKDARWLEGRVKAMWSGIIGISADRIPWVGRVPPKLAARAAPQLSPTTQNMSEKNEPEKARIAPLAAPGEWLAAGYSGEGMAHAFLSGRALAFQVLDRASDAAAWFPECLSVTETRWEKAHAEDLIEELWG